MQSVMEGNWLSAVNFRVVPRAAWGSRPGERLYSAVSIMVPEFRPIAEHPPLWRQIIQQVRERLRPEPEPDLHLESKPIPVKDIWSQPHTRNQRLGSIAIHAAIIGILLLPFWHAVRPPLKKPAPTVELFEPTLMAPGPSLPKMKHLAGGGSPVHISPPKLVQVQAPPMKVTPPLKLIPTSAPPNLELASIGDIGSVAGPPGTSAGNGGPGPGGAGSDANGGGNCVNGPCGVGGDIVAPVGIYTPDPQYSDAAREAKLQGTVTVSVVIGTDGHVYDPRVIQPLGLGLDQKALEALRLWRFRPAERNGRPVKVAANIEVNFRLF